MQKHALAASLILALSATTALAQTPAMPAMPGNQEDAMKMMHLAAHNQLGVLQYCQAQGFVGTDVIDLQKRILGLLPPAQVAGIPAAEESGRKGVVVFGTTQMPIADAAKAQSTTPEALCKKMGTMLQAQAANLPR